MIWLGYYLLVIMLFFILLIGGIVYHSEKKKDLHMSTILNRIFFLTLSFNTIALYLLMTNGYNICDITQNIFCNDAIKNTQY